MQKELQIYQQNLLVWRERWPGFNPANRCSVLSWARSEPLQFKLKWFAWQRKNIPDGHDKKKSVEE